MKPHKHRWTHWTPIGSSSPLWYEGWRQIRKCNGCLSIQRVKINYPTLPERVSAKHVIYQSPFAGGPVPRGTKGFVQDEADGYIWVDFGGIYGTVCCERGELK